MLRALTSADDDDVQIAQVYLRHRPIADVGRAARDHRRHRADERHGRAGARARYARASRDVGSRKPGGRWRACSRAPSPSSVQRAIAGVLIRADYQTLARPELARALRQHRLKSPDGEDLIDVLIRRLQSH